MVLSYRVKFQRIVNFFRVKAISTELLVQNLFCTNYRFMKALGLKFSNVE